MEEEIGKLEKVLSMIKGIEEKNLEFDNFISNLNIYSRTNLLKEISFNIIKNSKLFQGLNVDFRDVHLIKEKKEEILTNNFIGATILKILNNPMKKIIFLREFLDNLEDISQNDKDVILQSLKDKDDENLNQELSNLVQIFKKHD